MNTRPSPTLSQKQPLRAVLYARVSTDDPRQAGSCATQIERCRQYCAALGYSVVAEVADEGVSGSTMDRPAWRRVEALLRGREADIVLSTSLDRMSRNLRGFLDFVEAVITPSGSSFGTLQESIDTSTAQGRMLLHVLLAFAQFQRDQTAEKISGARATRAAAGLHATRCPFATLPGPRRGIPVPDPLRWPALERMFELKASGMHYSAITRRLKAEFGLVLNSSSVEKILASRFYRPQNAPVLGRERCGHVAGAEGWLPGLHECTLPRDVWEAAQARGPESTHGPQRIRLGGAEPQGADYLLDGLVVSSHFAVTHPAKRRGEPAPYVCAWVAGRGGRRYHCYVRADKRRVVGGLELVGGDDGAAELPGYVNAEALDQLVLQGLLEAAGDGQLAEALALAYSAAGGQDEALEEQEQALSRRQRQLKREGSQLRETVLRLAREGKALAIGILEERLAALAADESAVEQQLSDLRAARCGLQSRAAQTGDTLEHVGLIRRAWQEGHSEALRPLIRSLVSKVDLRLDGIVVELFDLQPVLQFKGIVAPTGIEPVPSP